MLNPNSAIPAQIIYKFCGKSFAVSHSELNGSTGRFLCLIFHILIISRCFPDYFMHEENHSTFDGRVTRSRSYRNGIAEFCSKFTRFANNTDLSHIGVFCGTDRSTSGDGKIA